MDWEERSDGLHGTWELDDSERAQEVGRLVQRGMLSYFSIGFQPQTTEWTIRDDREHVTIRRARLVEVSLVSTPAYAEAIVTGFRSAPGVLAELSRRICSPVLPDAVTGTPAQVETAANLVQAHIEEYGAVAAERLADVAESASDPVLRLNLGRASAALQDADRGALSRIAHDKIRRDFGIVRGRAAPPRRRRR